MKKKYLTIFLYAAIIFCVITSLAVWRQLDPRAMRLKPQWFSFKLSADETTAWQAIKMVPAHASVGVQSAFPQLTSRKVVTHIPFDLDKFAPDYLILSEKLDFWPMGSHEVLKKFVADAKSRGYKTILEENGVYLLKKNHL